MPRRPADFVPSYRLHRSSGQAIVTLSSRDHLLGEYESRASKVKYHELVARWIANGRKTLNVTPPVSALHIDTRLTVDGLLDAHVRHSHTYYVDVNGKPTTEINAYEAATAPVRELFGPTPAAEFTPTKLKSVRARMIAKGWARTLINRQVSRIRSVWKWAASEELVEVAVYQTLATVTGLKRGRSAAKESRPIKPVPAASVAAVKPFVASPVWALIELQQLTGARGGELFKLRAIDIDTKGKVWTYTPKEHKTSHFGHERIIYFGPKAQDVLRTFMRNRPIDVPLFSPREGNAERKALQAITARRAGQPIAARKTKRQIRDHYDRESYRRAIARACKLAEVPRWHPHQLRHTAATSWRREHGPEAALTLLGDKTTRMIDVYAEKDHQTAMRIAAENG